MKRLVALAIVAFSALAGPAAAAHADTYTREPVPGAAVPVRRPVPLDRANGEYTGHDEPSVLFYSHRPGTGATI